MSNDNKPVEQPKICSICQQPYYGYGNNAKPVNDGRCCDMCNFRVVVAARLNMLERHK